MGLFKIYIFTNICDIQLNTLLETSQSSHSNVRAIFKRLYKCFDHFRWRSYRYSVYSLVKLARYRLSRIGHDLFMFQLRIFYAILST